MLSSLLPLQICSRNVLPFANLSWQFFAVYPVLSMVYVHMNAHTSRTGTDETVNSFLSSVGSTLEHLIFSGSPSPALTRLNVRITGINTNSCVELQ